MVLSAVAWVVASVVSRVTSSVSASVASSVTPYRANPPGAEGRPLRWVQPHQLLTVLTTAISASAQLAVHVF